MNTSHRVAILQALFVTFLWSTSWVFIKIGLNDVEIPPLTFAGLRYSIAFLVLLGAGGVTNRLGSIRQLTRRQWGFLLALGLIFYTVTQGAQFLALIYLPSATLSLLLNFSAIVVAIAGIRLLQEYPTRQQWYGIGLFILGVLIYFYPIQFPETILLGLLIGMVATLANAGGAILGRYVNRGDALSPYIVTLVSMGFGAIVLLLIGLGVEEVPTIPARGWVIILILAVVNTAFAFTLWNVSLQTLSATESSVINNTMLIQIAVLAWVFLGEEITLQGGIGLLAAAIGILIVQLRRGKSKT